MCKFFLGKCPKYSNSFLIKSALNHLSLVTPMDPMKDYIAYCFDADLMLFTLARHIFFFMLSQEPVGRF